MSVKRIGNAPAGPGGHPLPFSPAVRAGDFIFISGQVPTMENGQIDAGGIESQTRSVMENLKRILKGVTCSFEDVAKANCWLDDPRDFATFNRVFAEYFPNGGPARSTVRSQLMIDAKVEIDLIVYSPQAE